MPLPSPCLKLSWAKDPLEQGGEKWLFFLWLIESIAATRGEGVIRRRRRRRKRRRRKRRRRIRHFFQNRLCHKYTVYCYNWICERARDSISNQWRQEGKSISVKSSPSGASLMELLCTKLENLWSDSDTWVKMTPFHFCGDMGAWRSHGWAWDNMLWRQQRVTTEVLGQRRG